MKNNKRKTNNNHKNKDQSWYKNQIKSNSKGWNWKKKFKKNYIAIKSLRTKFNIIRNNMIFLNFLQLSEINTALVFDWDRLDEDKVNKKRYIFI